MPRQMKLSVRARHYADKNEALVKHGAHPRSCLAYGYADGYRKACQEIRKILNWVDPSNTPIHSAYPDVTIHLAEFFNPGRFK